MTQEYSDEITFNLISSKQMYFTGQFQSMAHAMQKKQAGYHLLVDTYLIQLLFFVNNLFCSSVSAQTLQSEPIVKEIMEYIRTHLQEEISLTSLSDALSLSKYHLCHIFKEQTGTKNVKSQHLRWLLCQFNPLMPVSNQQLNPLYLQVRRKCEQVLPEYRLPKAAHHSSGGVSMLPDLSNTFWHLQHGFRLLPVSNVS